MVDTEESAPTSEELAKRAYELYVARGGENGRALDDWLAAEKEWSEKHSSGQKTQAMAARSSVSPTSEFKSDAADNDRLSSPRKFLTSR